MVEKFWRFNYAISSYTKWFFFIEANLGNHLVGDVVA